MSRPVPRRALLLGALGVATAACAGKAARPTAAPSPSSRPTTVRVARSPAPVRTTTTKPVSARPADIVARATVPVLCWHQLRDWTAHDSAYDRQVLICPPANFRRQLDTLVAHGYTAIGPDQYLAHLTGGARLPAKPVLLTFDDSQGSQIGVGLPELRRRKLTATFFVMTVPLDKPGWMSTEDVRALAAAGMTVGAHTWDHHRADRYTGADWKTQLVEPKAELERILQRKVDHFAYPYGAWNQGDIPHLVSAGYRTAFQLAGRPDPAGPLYTLPRMLVGSSWTAQDLLAHLT